ncbi:hypothetical protein TspCOW1_11080 [Thiohalobacter sp. COW1]|uniref:Uncharacterized protein n=1 Tax=Thiohalobacter thiocyanaticus TaxID=585455 RepID=A0A1Z4VQM1_9GAMM|nr:MULTISPECIES: hypothetical protein [Thiohalobacter]BAZ93927.1 uncharacterized protein FOKN1_1532 [Thiohalobacter thiocyanaticus]BCO31005.1 hypothetical protein TspCOW1_11080 [Thiohalobacter sp. COW1]
MKVSVSPRYHTDPRNLELELTLRDMLAGMEEIYTSEALAFSDCGMEILSIEPPAVEAQAATAEPVNAPCILPFRRSA